MPTPAAPAPKESTLDTKKKTLDEKLASLEALQKEIVALKTDIQLLETGNSEIKKAEAEYVQVKDKVDKELNSLKEYAAQEQKTADGAIGKPTGPLEAKMAEKKKTVDDAAGELDTLNAAVTTAEKTAAEKSAEGASADEAYDQLKGYVQNVEKQMKAVRGLKDSIEKAKAAKDTPRVFVLTRQLGPMLDALQLKKPDDLKTEMESALSAREKVALASRTAKQDAADAKATYDAAAMKYRALQSGLLDEMVKVIAAP